MKRREPILRSNAALLALLIGCFLVACTSDPVVDLLVDDDVAQENATEEIETLPPLEGQRAVADDSPPKHEPGPFVAEPGKGIEWSETPVQLQTILETDDGFIGYGSEWSQRQLWHSPDGIEWSALPRDGLPAGQLVGFDRIDGEYLVAVNQLDIPREDGVDLAGEGPDPFDEEPWPQVDISIWRSDDARTWTQSSEHQRYIGPVRGWVLAVFDDVGWHMAAQLPHERKADGRLVEYLAPIVDEATALDTCFAIREGRGAEQILRLYDCDQNEIFMTLTADHPSRTINPDCVRSLRSLDESQPVWLRFRNDGTRLEIPAPHSNAAYAAITEPAIVFLDRWPNYDVQGVCQTDEEKNLAPSATMRRWDANARELVEVALPPGANNLSRAWLTYSDEGLYTLHSRSQIWEARELDGEWTMRIDHPHWPSDKPNRFSGLLLSSDGSMTVAYEPGRIHLELERGEWAAVDINNKSEYPRLLIVTDTHAIIDPGGWPALLKVQLR